MDFGTHKRVLEAHLGGQQGPTGPEGRKAGFPRGAGHDGRVRASSGASSPSCTVQTRSLCWLPATPAAVVFLSTSHQAVLRTASGTLAVCSVTLPGQEAWKTGRPARHHTDGTRQLHGPDTAISAQKFNFLRLYKYKIMKDCIIKDFIYKALSE